MGTSCSENKKRAIIKPIGVDINKNQKKEIKKTEKEESNINVKILKRTKANTEKNDASKPGGSKKKPKSDKGINRIEEREKKKEKKELIDIEENKKKIKKIKNPNLMKSYLPKLNIENNYYIVCPSCQLLFPTIKDFEYDKKKKDFKISYICQCNSSKNLSKSYFLDFVNSNRPSENNEIFNKSKVPEKLMKAIEEKEDFPGKGIMPFVLGTTIDINCPPPPASIKKSIKESNLIKSLYPNFKASKLVSIKEENIEEDDNNKKNKNKKKREVIFSQGVSQIEEDEEKIDDIQENCEYKKYTCVKTFQKNARIGTLIELESGHLASGSYDCKICIWDINQPSGSICEKEFQENGNVICLLEFQPNYLLAGTNFNYISLWDLNSDKKYSEYVFLGHEKWVNALVKCNEEIFASCSNDRSIITWDYYKRKQIRSIKAHEDCILSLIKLKDNTLCSGGADLITKIWNWETGECLLMLEGFNNWIRCLTQFDDRTLLVGSENTITIWKNNEIIGHCSQHKHDVRDLCVIDKKYFASSSFDNTIKIWEIDNLNCVQTLEGHTSNVINLIKLKGSKNLASCSTDYTIKIWKQDD